MFCISPLLSLVSTTTLVQTYHRLKVYIPNQYPLLSSCLYRPFLHSDLSEVFKWKSVSDSFLLQIVHWLPISSLTKFHCCCCSYVASVVSDSVQPHRRQPTRLLCPQDSPGKNAGVGCHFLPQQNFIAVCLNFQSSLWLQYLCQILQHHHTLLSLFLTVLHSHCSSGGFWNMVKSV